MPKLENVYNLLRRKTNTTTFIPQIDGLRFLAIILVVMYHINGFVITKVPFGFTRPPADYWWLFNIFDPNNGRKGVLLFFVISGFILALPFAKSFWQGAKEVKLKSYFLRRLTRLEPPYIITMVSCYVALLFYQGHDFRSLVAQSPIGLLPNLGASLVYLHNIIYPNTFSVNPVAWSLEIEIQFYLLVPFLVLILKLSEWFRRVLLLFLIFLFTFLQHLFHPTIITLFNFIQYFLLGFLLVDVYLSGWKPKINFLISFLAGIVSLVFILYPDLYRAHYYEYLFIPVLFMLCVLALTSEFWQKIFSIRFFTVIGGMCYSIYLWHDNIVSVVGNKLVLFNFSHSYPLVILWQLVCLLFFVVLGSGIFYLLIERPCMDKDWPIRLWRAINGWFNRKQKNIELVEN